VGTFSDTVYLLALTRDLVFSWCCDSEMLNLDALNTVAVRDLTVDINETLLSLGSGPVLEESCHRI